MICDDSPAGFYSADTNSQRQSLHVVKPLLCLGDVPDQQEILNNIANRQLVGDEDQSGATTLFNALLKASGHCADVVRNEDTSERLREVQDLRVWRLLGNYGLSSFEIDRRLPDPQASHDLLIEIGVSEEADFQRRPAPACSLASRNRLASGESDFA